METSRAKRALLRHFDKRTGYGKEYEQCWLKDGFSYELY